MKRFALVAVIAACGNTNQTPPDQLNFNRPIDVAFACYGGLRITGGNASDPTQPVETTAQPVEACDVRSGTHDVGAAVPVPPGQEDLTASGGVPVPAPSWYAFVLQSVPGTVVFASWDTKPSSAFAGGDITIRDSDPLTPGNNGVTIGEHPVALATDRVGCFEVSANAGTCDLSTLQINSALGGDASKFLVDRLDVKSSTGTPLHARPAAMKVEPATGTIGVECPATATGIAYIAYPSCHLVAEVDMATGNVLAGIQYDATGVPTIVGGNVSCPDECAGAVTAPGPRPVALDLQHDPRSDRRLLAIGADNSAVLTYVELGIDYSPLSVSQQAFQDPTGTLGITDVAISPQMGMGGSSGVIDDETSLGGQSQFIYAVATDRSIRVADILNVRRECDAEVDPRYLYSIKDVRKLSCLPVGDPATPPRRPGARGPGIELVGHAVPISIQIFKVDPIPNDSRTAGTPQRLIGYFGLITGADGGTYVLNVNDDDFADYVNPTAPLATQIPMDIAHQLRDAIGGNFDTGRGLLAETDVNGVQMTICDDPGPNPDAQGNNGGGARAAQAPTFTVPAVTIAPEKVGALPSIRQVKCVGTDEPNGIPVSELSFAAPVSVRDLEFPDLRGLSNDETWTLSWEGTLSNDTLSSAVDGPQVRESPMYVDGNGARLDDATRPFCNAGVERYDIIQFRGCDPSIGDADCPLGYSCYVHPNSQVAGLGACMLTTEADRLADACKDFLTSLRTYTVGKAANGELQLLPRKHVLPTTPIDGCATAQQCQTLANYAVQLASSTNPIDQTLTDSHSWTCAADPDRAPLTAPGNTGMRCIETCDTGCSTGTVCENGDCMESVVPPQACVNAPQRFEIHAHDALTVLGTRTGYTHPIIADAGGNCIHDPTASPLQIGRIPLTAPACDPTADPRTGKRSDGSFDADPCELTVDEAEKDLTYVAGGTCVAASIGLVTRQAQAIRFRNRGLTLTIVDPTYPGDGVCIGDRGGNLGNVPTVTAGIQLSFHQIAGFTPLILAIQPSLPVKVVRGPTDSLWVIDEGDYLSTSINAPSTRGKVFRVEAAALGTVNVLE